MPRARNGRDLDSFADSRKCDISERLAVCLGCLVANECLEFALAGPAALQGIWSGTTQRERWEIPKKRWTSAA
jgi:hypothetical protein